MVEYKVISYKMKKGRRIDKKEETIWMDYKQCLSISTKLKKIFPDRIYAIEPNAEWYKN